MITYEVTLENLKEYFEEYINKKGDKVIYNIEPCDGTSNLAYKINLTNLEDPHGNETGITDVIEVKKTALGYKR